MDYRIDPGRSSTPYFKAGDKSLSFTLKGEGPVQEIRLPIESKPWKDQAIVAGKRGLKFTFFPITLLATLIHKSCAYVVNSEGLGEEKDVRKINQDKRSDLKSLGGQEIRFGFEDKPLLEGMYFKADPPNPNAKTILICSGSHLSYENYTVPMVESLKSMGHNVMVFNYEGFGNSEGTRSEKGVYRSVEAAYQYLKQEKKCTDENIVGWGYSLGGAAAAHLASKHKVDIVIDRGFSSMSQVAYQEAPKGLKTMAKVVFMVGGRFDNLSKLKRASGNVLIVQGTKDDVAVKGKHGEFLTKAVPNSNLMQVDSGHHHGEYDDPLWFGIGKDTNAVQDFLNQVREPEIES